MLKNMIFIAFAIALVAGINVGAYNNFVTMNSSHEAAADGSDF